MKEWFELTETTQQNLMREAVMEARQRCRYPHEAIIRGHVFDIPTPNICICPDGKMFQVKKNPHWSYEEILDFRVNT